MSDSDIVQIKKNSFEKETQNVKKDKSDNTAPNTSYSSRSRSRNNKKDKSKKNKHQKKRKSSRSKSNTSIISISSQESRKKKKNSLKSLSRDRKSKKHSSKHRRRSSRSRSYSRSSRDRKSRKSHKKRSYSRSKSYSRGRDKKSKKDKKRETSEERADRKKKSRERENTKRFFQHYGQQIQTDKNKHMQAQKHDNAGLYWDGFHWISPDVQSNKTIRSVIIYGLPLDKCPFTNEQLTQFLTVYMIQNKLSDAGNQAPIFHCIIDVEKTTADVEFSSIEECQRFAIASKIKILDKECRIQKQHDSNPYNQTQGLESAQNAAKAQAAAMMAMKSLQEDMIAEKKSNYVNPIKSTNLIKAEDVQAAQAKKQEEEKVKAEELFSMLPKIESSATNLQQQQQNTFQINAMNPPQQIQQQQPQMMFAPLKPTLPGQQQQMPFMGAQPPVNYAAMGLLPPVQNPMGGLPIPNATLNNNNMPPMPQFQSLFRPGMIPPPK